MAGLVEADLDFIWGLSSAPLSQLRFNPKGAPRKDLGDVLKPLLDPNLDA